MVTCCATGGKETNLMTAIYFPQEATSLGTLSVPNILKSLKFPRSLLILVEAAV